MKYAILNSGGKQYVAREGATIEVDRLPIEAGKPIEFKDVLLVADNGDVSVGTPMVKGASVKGRVIDEVKAAKIIVFKYVPKQRYRRKQGHRQRYTRVMIDKILSGPAAATSADAEAEAPAKPAAEKPAAKAKAKSQAKPAAKKSPAKEPAGKKPAAETKKTTSAAKKKPAAAKSAAKKPAAKKPAAKKPAEKSSKPVAKKSAGSSKGTKKPPTKKK